MAEGIKIIWEIDGHKSQIGNSIGRPWSPRQQDVELAHPMDSLDRGYNRPAEECEVSPLVFC